MEQELRVFETKLRQQMCDVQPPERLAPEKIGALLADTRRRSPSVHIVRRVSAVAAAVLVFVLGGMVLLRSGAVSGAGAMEPQACDTQNESAQASVFDGLVGTDCAPAEMPPASTETEGESDGYNAAAEESRADEPEAASADDNGEEKEQGGETDFDALVEREKQRLEAARAKGETK